MKKSIIPIITKLILIITLTLSLAVMPQSFLTANAASDNNEQNKTAINVKGNATVKISPDIAYITIGVTTIAKNSKDAQKENKIKMDNVYKKLKSLDIKNENIQTVQYNIYPKYEQNNIEFRDSKGIIQTKYEDKLVGYEVNNMIRITIKNLDITGQVLDMSVEEGINKATSISFGISEEKKNEALLKALKKAVENAKLKAKVIADVHSISLDKPLTITERYSYTPSPVRYNRVYDTVAEESKTSISTPISAGEMEMQVNVDVTY